MVSVYNVDIKCSSCTDIVNATKPENRTKYALVGLVILGTLGLGIGLSIGIATAGLGMAAFPFTAVIGAYIGYRTGGWAAEKKDGVTCPECGHDFA